MLSNGNSLRFGVQIFDLECLKLYKPNLMPLGLRKAVRTGDPIPIVKDKFPVVHETGLQGKNGVGMDRRLFRLTIAIYGMWICFVASASPVLSIDAPRLDFSRIEAMANPTNAMEVVNTGDSPLVIHRVRACCGAKACVSATRVEPGESATLTVSLGHMAKPGPFRKKVTLYTNDPAAPVVEIPIVGEVVEAKAKGRGIYFGADVVLVKAQRGFVKDYARRRVCSSRLSPLARLCKAFHIESIGCNRCSFGGA